MADALPTQRLDPWVVGQLSAALVASGKAHSESATSFELHSTSLLARVRATHMGGRGRLLLDL